MGSVIHAKKTKKGFQFREYSTTSDMYHTPPLTRDEMTLYLILNTALEYGINSFNLPSIPERIERACEQGTSEREVKRTLDKWEKRPQDYAGKVFPVAKTKEALLEDIKESLQSSLYEHILSSLKYQEEIIKGIDRFKGKKNSGKIEGLIGILLKTSK